MKYLMIFLTFLKIGAVSFGGGYGMISIVKEECLNNGWLTEGEFLDFIGIAESTPGPIAVNMATFIGSSQAGFLGALLATIGVILPAFLIILISVALLTKLLKYAGVKSFLNGVQPVIVSLILTTAITLFLSMSGIINNNIDSFSLLMSIFILLIIIIISVMYKMITKKKINSIILIIISGILGIILFS